MIVITTRTSTSVKPFRRLIAPPTMRLWPPEGTADLLVLHAPRGGGRRRLSAVVAARTPHVEAAGVQDRRAQHRDGPSARSALGGRRLIVPVVDPGHGRLPSLP